MRRFLFLATMLLFLPSSSLVAQAQSIGWPEAIEALAQEKSKATACVNLLNSVADENALADVKPIYAEAKATSDGVIAALSVILFEGGKPGDLPRIREKLEASGAGLERVCDAAARMAHAKGGKGPLDKIITASLSPIIETLKSAVGAIFDYWKETKKIERERILGELRDTKWPNF